MGIFTPQQEASDKFVGAVTSPFSMQNPSISAGQPTVKRGAPNSVDPAMAPKRGREASTPDPTAAPNYGWGNQQGRAENFYDQRNWNQPGQAAQYWAANAGKFGGNGNFGAYYDQAAQRGNERLANQFRANGMFGSSANQDAMVDFNSNLEAERANREADFNLGANKAGFEAALGVDANARANDYFRSQAATTADNAFRNRENDKYSQIMDLLGITGGIYDRGISGGLAADQDAFDSANNASAASAAATQNRNTQEYQDFLQSLGMGAKQYDSYRSQQVAQTQAPIPPGYTPAGPYQSDGYMYPRF